jgi:hypothetical protein
MLDQIKPVNTSEFATRKAWSNDAFQSLCEMYQNGKITLDQFCALIEGGAC